jgi:hypothetical protein
MEASLNQVPAITVSLLLVASLIGCSHFAPPDPDRFRYEEPVMKLQPSRPKNYNDGVTIPGDSTGPGSPGYYSD